RPQVQELEILLFLAGRDRMAPPSRHRFGQEAEAFRRERTTRSLLRVARLLAYRKPNCRRRFAVLPAPGPRCCSSYKPTFAHLATARASGATIHRERIS